MIFGKRLVVSLLELCETWCLGDLCNLKCLEAGDRGKSISLTCFGELGHGPLSRTYSSSMAVQRSMNSLSTTRRILMLVVISCVYLPSVMVKLFR
jgi:hypothetical protein